MTGASGAWHILTGEYPPKLGGVADYSFLVARGLAEVGDEVHVWCPGWNPEPPSSPGVEVHRELGQLAPRDLRRAGEMLNLHPPPRRLLVQWVPHAFGMRSLNLPFTLWLRERARRGDRVEVMVHEPFLPFDRGSWRRSAAAAVHRLMTLALLSAATTVWVSSPRWAERWKRYALGKELGWRVLPVPSNIPVVRDPGAVAALRARYGHAGGCVVGHFGTFAPDVAALLQPALRRLLRSDDRHTALLVGPGGERVAAGLGERAHAVGALGAREVSLHLQACDLMLQPYPGGVNFRRGSMMAALAHGRAVVTSGGVLTEPLWAEADGVALEPGEDPEALARRTGALLADARVRHDLGERAERFYDAHFDLAHTIRALRGGA